MRKNTGQNILFASGAAVVVFAGAAAGIGYAVGESTSGDGNQVSSGTASGTTSAPESTPEPTPSEEDPRGYGLLKEGDSASINDAYGGSYTLEYRQVRYVESVTDDYGSVIEPKSEDGVIALVDVTVTNDAPGSYEPFDLFTQHVDADDVSVPTDNTLTNGDGITLVAEDVEAHNLVSGATVPSGTSMKMTEVVGLPEKGGELVIDGANYRLDLPE